MKKLFSHLLWVGVLLQPICALGQLTIDATQTTRQRARNPTTGHVGSTGRKLPVHLVLAFGGPIDYESGKAIVEFVLTNTGKNTIRVPVSPNSADFETSNADLGYTVETLVARLNLSRDKKIQTLPGGADLYGNDTVPGSIVPLSPGESIRIRVRVVFRPEITSTEGEKSVLVGYLGLNEEVVKTVRGQPFSDVSEIGSATSQEYIPQLLFGSPTR